MRIFPGLNPVYRSNRSPVMGRGGMAASSQPMATAAGLEILSLEGNAADAAVAMAAVLNVTEPTSTGLGGDMFSLFYEAATGTITALNGSGRAPGALNLNLLQEKGMSEIPPYHPYTVTVPGACAGWCDLVERHGSLSLPVILAPAIHLAESGFPVAPITSFFWRRAAGNQLKTAVNGQEMLINGRGPNSGEIFKNPGLARTLRTIAGGGKKAFYTGSIANEIVRTLAAAGGCMVTDDLAGHVSTWDEPISTNHSGLRIWECPPNGQGIATLLALNILEGFDLPVDPLDPLRLHLEVEAMRLAFADTSWYVADPRKVQVPVEELLSKKYASQRRKLINPTHTTLGQEKGSPTSGSDTVYFCVVDQWGNACSFINSNYMGFGTGIVPKDCGFTLQNRGHGFSLDRNHPNSLAPGKRPYHTIIPAMITRGANNSLFGPMGVMGGFMQPQGHLQVFLALAQGLDPQTALDLPRFCLSDGTSGGVVSLEDGIPLKVVRALKELGHKVKRVKGWERALFGRGQVILREEESGILTGGSDPRADGCAMTLL
jgi:gamma-glutamyltranspeptidase/glutathione hydrolase